MSTRPSLAARPGRRRSAESGQALVILAISMAAIVAMAALLVDGGLGWSNQRLAHAAADTAAIAAAKSFTFSENVTTATNATNAVASSNGFEATYTDCDGVSKTDGVVIHRPPTTGAFAGNSNYVEVIVTRPMNTTFAAFIGQPCFMVSARAVAQTTPATPGGPAILAMGTECSSGNLHWNAHNVTVIGDVVSNGWIDMNDPDAQVQNGLLTYKAGCPTGTIPDVPGQYDAESTSTPTPDPFPYTRADFTCTVSSPPGGDLTITSATVDGVYCADRVLKIDNAAMTGTATFIAPKITCAKAANLNPKVNGVLMWSTIVSYGSDGINWKCGDMTWSGILYAPTSQLHITPKANTVISGNIWVWNLELGGDNWVIQGAATGGTPSDANVKLVE